MNAFVAQLVEQGTENPRVVGSIPTEGTSRKAEALDPVTIGSGTSKAMRI